MSAIELATEVAEAALSSLEDTGAGSIAPQPDADADVHVQLAAVKKELQAARAEIVALQTENARLRESAAASKSAASSYVHPPNFYPGPQAPYPGSYSNYYGAPYADPYGAPPGYGGYGQPPSSSWPKSGGPPQHPMGQRPGQLAMNAQNQRGPKGANLALFCIPNSYTDQHVYDLAKQFGSPIFCSVVTHRDTGLSRGYAFVSFQTLEEANSAISGLHNMSVEGRSLRCEVARQDREGGASSRPY